MELRIGCNQPVEDASLQAHKAGGRFADFHEAVGIDLKFHILANLAGIDRISRIQGLELRLRRSQGRTFGGPVFAFEGIYAGCDVAVGSKYPQSRLNGEANVGINKEKMGIQGVRKEECHAVVAGAGYETVSLAQVKVDRHPELEAGALKRNETQSVVAA